MKKELPYLCLCLVIFFALLWFPMDIKTLLVADATLDINVHDTYFVISTFDYVIHVFVFVFAFMYFLRVLFTKFQNRFASYLYLIFNGLFIVAAILNIVAVFFIEIPDTVTTDLNQQILNESINFKPLLYLFTGSTVIAFILEIYTFFRLRERR